MHVICDRYILLAKKCLFLIINHNEINKMEWIIRKTGISWTWYHARYLQRVNFLSMYFLAIEKYMLEICVMLYTKSFTFSNTPNDIEKQPKTPKNLLLYQFSLDKHNTSTNQFSPLTKYPISIPCQNRLLKRVLLRRLPDQISYWHLHKCYKWSSTPLTLNC